jgi:uncharacterized membrane protein
MRDRSQPPNGFGAADYPPGKAAATAASAVRLAHRRHAWAWTAAGSFLALLVITLFDLAPDQNATGPFAVLEGLITLLVVMALVVAVIAVAIDTIRLRRLPPADRERVLQAQAGARHPMRHSVGVAAGVVAVVVWLALIVTHLPGLVNGVAYLAGTQPEVSFVAQSYGQECGRDSCWTVTRGVLRPGGTAVTLTREVPLGATVTVRQPAWVIDSKDTVLDSTGAAVASIIFTAIFTALLGVTGASVALYYRRRHHWRAAEWRDFH